MVYLNYLGDMYFSAGTKQKCSGFLLANHSLDIIRRFEQVYVHGAGLTGFEARSVLSFNGINIAGICDNNPLLTGAYLNKHKILAPNDRKESFIVAAMLQKNLASFKTQMLVNGIENWGVLQKY